MAAVILAIPSVITWLGTGQQIRVQLLSREYAHDPSRIPGRAVILDADRLSGPLMVRTWQPGDRFCPLGMKGRSKKLQDFFTDLKVPIEKRTTVPILAAPEGIVWVVGYRQDERFAARASTRHYVVVSVADQSVKEGVR